MTSLLWTSILFLATASQGVEIKDVSEVTTRVSDLKYCYEEQEGTDVFVTRLDSFLVRKGEAVIRVDFTKLSSVSFMSEMADKDGVRVRKASIRMRTGKTFEEEILCHPTCFLSGDLDLGTYRLDMAKVKEMVFDLNETPATFKGCLVSKGTPNEAALSVLLRADGTIDFSRDSTQLERLIATHDFTVSLKAEEDLRYSTFIFQLKRLQEAGARSFLFIR